MRPFVIVDGDRLRKLRAQTPDLRTRKDVANTARDLHLHLSAGVLAKAETGQQVAPETAEAIAKVFGLHFNEVVLPEFRRPIERPEISLPSWPHRKMNAMFLLLDEELSNNRRMPPAYGAEEIAYWLNFYLIFFDVLFVPANFLLDSDLTPQILQFLRVGNKDSPLHSDGESPVQIIWDTARFHEATRFKELLKVMESDRMCVTRRDPAIAASTAKICDNSLKSQILYCDMTAHLDQKESIKQLESEAFNPTENQAIEEEKLSRLRNCLNSIVERGNLISEGDGFGYGRNFYYTIWGYAINRHQEKVADSFSDIIQEHWSLRNHFLTAVDYVSHSLKGWFASNALHRQIDIIMPKEYGTAILRPAKTRIVELNRESDKDESSPSAGILLSPNAVLNLTAQQLHLLHDSYEYREYATRMTSLNAMALVEISDSHLESVEEAFNEYLHLVERVLTPVEAHTVGGIRLAAKVVNTGAGISAQLIPGRGARAGAKSNSGGAVELWSATTPGAIGTQSLRNYSLNPLPQTIRLCREVNIYIR